MSTPYRRSVVSDEISQDLDRAIALAREFGIEGLDVRSVWGKTVHELDVVRSHPRVRVSPVREPRSRGRRRVARQGR